MRVSKQGTGFLALAAVLLAGPGAQANELLVMPYTCTMVGGQPLLTPGPEQSHRILGARDQRKFSACSPANPDMCRQWTVHRFDLDCDGARVPWVSVVAATNEGSRRAWLLNGRLLLRMGPWWSLAPDDPCAREPDPDDRLGQRRMRRHCADRLAAAPPPVVEMPFGYAPMLGIDGIIVKAAPGVSGAPPPAKWAGAEPPPQLPAGELPPLRPDAPRTPVAKEAPTTPAQPGSPPQVALHQPQPPPKAAPGTPTAPAATPPVIAAPKPVPAEAKPAAPAPVPTPKVGASVPPPPIADASKAATAEAVRPAAPAAPAPKAAPAKQAVQSAPPPEPAAEPEGAASGINLLSAFRATTAGAIVAFAGLALGLLAAFALARRHENVRDARKRPRDLATVSLDGKRATPSARSAGGRPPNMAAARVGRAAAPSAVAEWGDRIPRSRAEAYQVLGIGVAPSATEAAIKKVVDGLRQSWHPDLAKDEADRALRELRSKQINAAWELLRSQRAEV